MIITGTTEKFDMFLYNTFKNILSNGVYSENARPKYEDGTTAESKYITDVYIKLDLANGDIPLSSLRKTAVKTGAKELQWFYKDQTSDLSVLKEKGVNYWDDWALEDNSIGTRYGATVGRYKIIDRIIEGLKKNPFNRRNVISLWQYADLDEPGGLDPCFFEFMLDVRKVNGEMYLDGALTSRSSDLAVAGAINISQYSILLMAIAAHFGYKVGTISMRIMNAHIYLRHEEQVREMCNRFLENFYDIRSPEFEVQMGFDFDQKDFYDINFAEDLVVKNYFPITPQLKFEMAI